MARGKQTDPTVAVLAKVMSEMGFDAGIIAGVVKLPRGTVADIIDGNGPWREMPQNEYFGIMRLRVKAALENVADDLAMKAMAKLEAKLETASYTEALSIFNAVSSRFQ